MSTVEQMSEGPRVCPECGGELPASRAGDPRAVYCTETCRRRRERRDAYQRAAADHRGVGNAASTVSCRLPADVYGRVLAAADRSGRGVSGWLRDVILEALDGEP